MSEGSSEAGNHTERPMFEGEKAERARRLAVDISRSLDDKLREAGKELGREVDLSKREELARKIYELLGTDY